MSCLNYFRAPARHLSGKIVIKIQGLGHVPSFKNGKCISRKRNTGKPFVRTDATKKLWMERAIRLIESQLHGLYQTIESETPGACLKPLPTASWLPLDDSIQWMIPGEQKVVRVQNGSEGAIISIERLV